MLQVWSWGTHRSWMHNSKILKDVQNKKTVTTTPTLIEHSDTAFQEFTTSLMTSLFQEKPHNNMMRESFSDRKRSSLRSMACQFWMTELEFMGHVLSISGNGATQDVAVHLTDAARKETGRVNANRFRRVKEAARTRDSADQWRWREVEHPTCWNASTRWNSPAGKHGVESFLALACHCHARVVHTSPLRSLFFYMHDRKSLYAKRKSFGFISQWPGIFVYYVFALNTSIL